MDRYILVACEVRLTPEAPHRVKVNDNLNRGTYVQLSEYLEGVWDDNALNKSDLIYTVKPGVCIEFFGCDNASKVHGPARDILFINEAQRVPREIFRQLDVRTPR